MDSSDVEKQTNRRLPHATSPSAPPTLAHMAVVVVNYNTREHLRACLATVQSARPHEVVVVDNASSDGSVEMVRTAYPSVLLHANADNVGYGAAANQAIASCAAPYVLLLNSDTLIPDGTLQALSTYLDTHPRAAIVGPRLVSPDGTLQASCYPFPGTLQWFLDNDELAPLLRYIPILRGWYWRTWSHTSPQIVPWVKGAALAIRRQAFDAVGGFDTSFFMYFEETDLCFRLASANWQVHFTPVASVVHVGEMSTIQRRAEMTVQLVASSMRFCQLHHSRARFATLAIIMRLTILARLLRDSIHLRTVRGASDHSRLAADVAAWQRVLGGQWRGHGRDD